MISLKENLRPQFIGNSYPKCSRKTYLFIQKVCAERLHFVLLDTQILKALEHGAGCGGCRGNAELQWP
jgi:hypothetical protein